nr:reverse transcriptase domain-containing protein [Tanacetum cinerariifolium]
MSSDTVKRQVMVALVISISLDLSVESVGSYFPRVILIGSISIEVLVAPEVGAAAVASPVKVLEPETHSSLEADPSESSPPPISIAPMVLPFHVSRSRVVSRSSSPTIFIPKIPTAPILPAPSAVVTLALTVRKLLRPLPFYRLALRYTSRHLDRFTSGSSSCHSSLDHSSFGHSISGHSLSGHTPPDTTIADLATSPRFVYPPLATTPRYSEAYRRWRALVPSRTDLLIPCKRFRDSISPEDSVEEDIDTDVLADIEVEATTVEVIIERDVEAGVDAGIGMEVDVEIDVEDEVKDEVESNNRGTIEVRVDVVAGINIPNGMLMPDVVEFLEQAEEVVQDIYRHVMEIPCQRVASLERSNARLRGTVMMKSARADRFQRSYEANHVAELAVERQSQNGDDDDNRNAGGNGNKNGKGNRDGNGGGNGNGNGGGNGNGNPNRNDRGVVGLTRWFKKMETMFHISNCPERYQVKYATCTLLNSALTWWNVHKRTIGADVAFDMSRRELKKLTTEGIGGQSVARAFTAGSNEKKGYAGPLPYCKKCKIHHQGPCIVKCRKCNKVGQMTRDCMNAFSTTATQRAPIVNQRVPTCFECGRQGTTGMSAPN